MQQVMMQQVMPKLSRDSAAIVILAFAPAVGVGIARFAYGLLLPDMRLSLGWSYAAAGLMNTINAAGYLIGALGAAATIRRLGVFPAVLYGAGACVVAMLLSALTSNVIALGLVRLAAGIGGALAFVAGGVIAARLAQRHRQRATFLISLYYIGPGLGIAISGAVTPVLLEQLGPGSWWIAWGVLAVLSAVLTAVIALNPPDDVATATETSRERLNLLPAAYILVGYFLFSAGSIGYLTFMIAWVRESGGGAVVQSVFWTLIGIGGVSSPFLWAPLIARLSGGRAAAVLIAITVVCLLLPLVLMQRALLFGSALIFGGAFFAVVAATTAFARKNFPPAAWAAAIAAMTVAFGLGQTLGPVLSGVITDLTGSLVAGLAGSAALAAAGAGVALLQRDAAT